MPLYNGIFYRYIYVLGMQRWSTTQWMQRPTFYKPWENQVLTWFFQKIKLPNSSLWIK